MYRLGSKIIIIHDSIEQNLPLNEYGFIIAYEKNPDNVFDYVVRVPKINKNVYVTEQDIELEQTMYELEAERIQKEALIDYALANHNRELFDQIMNGNLEEEVEEDQVELELEEQIILHIHTGGTIRREVH